MLDLNYWMLDYNTDVSRQYMPDQVHKILKSFEYWFGHYPFYEDGYQANRNFIFRDGTPERRVAHHGNRAGLNDGEKTPAKKKTYQRILCFLKIHILPARLWKHSTQLTITQRCN